MSTSTESTTRQAEAEQSSSAAGPILFAVGVGGVIGFATMADDWIAAGFIFLVMCAAFLGFRSGAAKIAAGVVGMLLAIRYAVPIAPTVAPHIDRFVNLPPSLREPVVVFVGGCLIAVTAYLFVRIASGLVLRSAPQWKGVDRWLGAALGGVQGVIISSILLFSLVILEPIAQRQLDRPRDEATEWSLLPLSAKVVNWSAKVRLSSIGALMDAMEPLRLRFNDRLQHLTETLSTEAFQEPTIQAMLPNFIEGLRNDPRALQDLSARTGLDEQTLRLQLEHLRSQPTQ